MQNKQQDNVILVLQYYYISTNLQSHLSVNHYLKDDLVR